MKNKEIVMRIMAAHWDMKCCDCWICTEGRRNKLHVDSDYRHECRKYVVPPMDELDYRGNDGG